MHDGSIFSMCVLKDGTVITGGGKDGRILHFDATLNLTGEEAQVSRRAAANAIHTSLSEVYILYLLTEFIYLVNFRSKATLAVFEQFRKDGDLNCS